MLPDKASPVLTRELLYTAVTRAKKQVTVFGSPEIIQQTVRRRTQRTSGLKELLWPK